MAKNLDKKVEKLEEITDPNVVITIAGYSFTPAKLMVAFGIISSILGGLYGVFEVYSDYMNMKEVVKNIDISAVESRNKQIEIKLDEAMEYSKSIKNDLRDDFNRMEKNVDRVEDQNRNMEARMKSIIDVANQRFDNKRESLQSDTEIRIRGVEDRLNKKIQHALDNPLAR